MLDYLLVKQMVKKALEEIQPFKVQVESAKTTSSTMVRTIVLTDAATISRPVSGRQWEVLSGVIGHFKPAIPVRTSVRMTDKDANPWFFAYVAAASDQGLYPIDFYGQKLVVQKDDLVEMDTYNPGDSIILRVLETDA